MGKSKAPSSPDPKETSAAQTGTNIGTAVANSYLNNMNQVTPDGTLTYNQTGNKQYYDAYTGKTYDIPTFTAVTQLSPQQQAIKAQEDATNLNLGKLANSQSSRLNNLLGSPMNLSGAPAAGNASSLKAPTYQQYGSGPQLQTSVGTGQIQNSLGSAGDITRSYDLGDVTDYENAIMSRLNPQIEQDRSSLEQKLANQGIMPGSAAYKTAMTQLEQNVNDQRTSAVLSGANYQATLANTQNQQASFQNAAQQQAYSQLLASGQFANSAQQQAYEQAMGNANLGNNAKQQMYNNQYQATQGNNALAGQSFADQQTLFNAQNTARNQYLQEQYQVRNQPINEISALLSGAQVTNPNFVNTANSQIATTDVAGIINQDYQNRLGAYQQQQAQSNGILGGLFGLGNSLIMASDRRVKTDIKRVGTLDNGLPVYVYRYKAGGPPHIGVMAQDVQEVRPDAVHDIDGVLHVDYLKAVA